MGRASIRLKNSSVQRTVKRRAMKHADPAAAIALDAVAMHAELEALVREWQRVEHTLAIAAKRTGIDFYDICQGDRAEARTLRALERRIARFQENLFRKLEVARGTSATSVDGALAKLQLAILVQGPCDWHEHARELAEDGIAELRAMTETNGRLAS